MKPEIIDRTTTTKEELVDKLRNLFGKKFLNTIILFN